MQEKVVLVNKKDEWLGLADKLQAHKDGLLHRAISIFVLNDNGELLMQKRADNKYHSGGLWTNTCCSHPRAKESTIAAAHRRLYEEMGFDCELEPIFDYLYRSDVGDGLTEHEFDHVFIGYHDGAVNPDASEVSSYEYVSVDSLVADIADNPDNYTTWFKLMLPRFIEYLNEVKAA